ncbi:iron uptake porin [Argonema antarcticum]|uniref:iron uptake porin n=1 Tax=Argonema antarcticum TaxID=2942763 RepID=UPI0020129EE1|nr:iron uptake porin [Argonema antarcticum]MCL1472769.1 iron uptake porin [Argonema antarcticum A004/B2]
MLKLLCNYLLLSPAVLGATLAIAAATMPASYADEIPATPQVGVTASPDATSTLNQINRYNNEKPKNSLSQVTSVSQLRDVQPTDWAFQALQSLVERYGCIEGYPDRTYRGNRALTRYEFAAGLNSCLNRIQELIAAAGGGGISAEEIATLRRLQEEFRAELTTLRGRVDALEARAARLEAQQFSTTTKLQGEAIFAVAGIVKGDDAFGREIDNQPIFADRVRLNFETSFTGRDRLRTRLQASNLAAFSATSTFTPEGDLSFGGGPFEESGNNDIVLDELSYTFPLGKRTEVVIGANATGSDSFANTLNVLDGDGGSGALSRFGTRHGIYYLADGAGIGLKHEFNDNIEISLGYQGTSVNDPSDGSGLFGGPYGALAQVVFKPGAGLQLGLTYVHSYNRDMGTGSRVANLRSTLDAFQPFAGDNNLPISSNSYGVELSWQLARNFVIGGWAGYTNTRTLSTLGGQINRGNIDIFNGAVTLGFPDLGKKGNLGGIIVGIEPIADASANLSNDLFNAGLGGDDDDPSYHVEAFYQIQVSDNISITPGVIWLTAPDHNKNNDDIVIGTIRTTFSF